jgi:hypothetical protein
MVNLSYLNFININSYLLLFINYFKYIFKYNLKIILFYKNINYILVLININIIFKIVFYNKFKLNKYSLYFITISIYNSSFN